MDSIRIMRSVGLTVVTVAGIAACSGEAPEPRPAAATDRSPEPAATDTARDASAANTAPIVESVTLTPAEPNAYDSVQAQVKVSDADGDRAVARYTWWVNGRSVGEGSSYDLADTRRGAKIEVSVVADDGQAQSEPVTASVTLGNTAPRIESIRFEPSGDWHAGRSMAALPEAIDPDADPLTFEYVWYVNDRPLQESGPTIDGSELARGDRVQLVVVASDGYAKSEELRTEEIEVANSAPEITSAPGAIGPDGFFRYQIEANDPDGDRAFMYRLVQGPPGMELDLQGGKLVWQPREAHAGAHTIEVEVDDRMGGTVSQQFTLDVTFDGTPPASPN